MLAKLSTESVRGYALAGEAERPLSDLEIEAIAAAEQARAAAAAAAKVHFLPCASDQILWAGLQFLYI